MLTWRHMRVVTRGRVWVLSHLTDGEVLQVNILATNLAGCARLPYCTPREDACCAAAQITDQQDTGQGTGAGPPLTAQASRLNGSDSEASRDKHKTQESRTRSYS